jgi:dTDP-4-amino-4,6-dideoxygalactose transaminase
MAKMNLPFNRALSRGNEQKYIEESLRNQHLKGDGPFTKRCHEWLEKNVPVNKALLTHSCTGALEMMALLANLKPGDEVIMPSFTFSSTANAVALRGAVPVFIDIRPDTLNMDEKQIEAALSPKTKAIMVVHYAGVGAEMDVICEIATQHKLLVIEDAAQALLASYKGRPLGTIGHLGALSFHETKNVISGEGGALLINDVAYSDRAEIIREKGTDRSLYFRGQVDKYTWVDVGSSYLPSELIAAVLYAQLEMAEQITHERLALWNHYHEAFKSLEKSERVRRPVVPAHCHHNGHIYYLIAGSLGERTQLIETLKQAEVQAVYHYIPLHSSPAGLRFGRSSGNLHHTSDLSDRQIRLPMWAGMTKGDVEKVVESVHSFYKR